MKAASRIEYVAGPPKDDNGRVDPNAKFDRRPVVIMPGEDVTKYIKNDDETIDRLIKSGVVVEDVDPHVVEKAKADAEDLKEREEAAKKAAAEALAKNAPKGSGEKDAE